MALHVRIRKTRPRVCISEDSLPGIRTKIETTHLEEWSQLVVWSRGIAKTPLDYRLRPERLSERGRRLAFMYAVRHDDKDLEFALEVLPRLTDAKPTAPKVEALAQLYDSLWSVLPAKMSAKVKDALLVGARTLFDENIRGAPVLARARSESIPAVFAAGVSLFGDVDEAQHILGEAVHASRDLTGTLMHFLEEDGGFPLGWANSFVHVGQLPKLALLAESGLGQSWPREAPWLERYVEFLDVGLRRNGADVREGPVWADGSRTLRRLDLWRVLATVAGYTDNATAKRLLAAIPLRGCQDEKILYEMRSEGGARAQEADGGAPPLSKFYRRAGLAIFRGPKVDGRELEVVIHCPVAQVSESKSSGAGSFSLASLEDIVLDGPATRNSFAIGVDEAKDSEEKEGTSFPRTRREINLPKYRRSEILVCENIGGVCEWLTVDLTRDHGEATASIMRSFMFMRELPNWPQPALVIFDDVRLKTPGGDVAVTVHFAAKPKVVGDVVACQVGEEWMSAAVLLPKPNQIWLDELVGIPAPVPLDEQQTRSVWRLRVGSKEAGARNLFCQVFLVGDKEGDPAKCCSVLHSSGATVAGIAGRGLVFAQEETEVIEGITTGPLKGIVIAGVRPSVRARLEVAGEEPRELEASDGGGIYFDAELPPETGFRIGLDSMPSPDGRRKASMRSKAVEDPTKDS